MPDSTAIAGWLLVLGPVLGLVPVAYPPFLPIWSAPRKVFLATVVAHRRAWAWLNAGFAAATVVTAIGLAVLAGDGSPGRLAVAVAYAFGGVVWLAVLAIRTRTTPLLGDLVAAGADPGPAEGLIGAATGGLFAAFTVVTALSLAGLGALVATGRGGTPALVAGVIAAGVALLALVSQLRTGDSIPAVLYVPTLVVGIAVLGGWT